MPEHLKGGHQEDAEEFLGFYLDTLEEELLALLSSISPPKPTSAVSEEREEGVESGEGWTEVGKRNKIMLTRTVCLLLRLCIKFGRLTLGQRVDGTHRSSQSSRPSRVYSVASSDPHYERHINATRSSSRTGGHSNSTFRFVVSPWVPFTNC